MYIKSIKKLGLFFSEDLKRFVVFTVILINSHILNIKQECSQDMKGGQIMLFFSTCKMVNVNSLIIIRIINI